MPSSHAAQYAIELDVRADIEGIPLVERFSTGVIANLSSGIELRSVAILEETKKKSLTFPTIKEYSVMAFWDKLMGEFVDIIEWTDDSNDTLVWRFDRYQNEIKYGAKLTVRQAQVAIFVNEGQIADIFTSGMYELETQNLPILSTLKGWRHGFDSSFKAEVYFINLRTLTDIKWGTKNPVMLRDPEFGAIRIRAFGNFNVQVADPKKLLEEIVGTDGHFELNEIQSQLKTLAVSRFSDAVAESNIPILDLAANYDELSDLLQQRMNPDFEQYGLGLQNLLVENISLPTEVEKALDKRSSIGLLGNLERYTQYQSANAIEEAARNPSGDAGAGVGMGMGFAMANQMGRIMGPQPRQTRQPSPSESSPPPLPDAPLYFVAVDGKQAGPFPLSDVEQKIMSNKLLRDSLVWTEGMEKWQEAEQVADLKPLFSKVPPPIR